MTTLELSGLSSSTPTIELQFGGNLPPASLEVVGTMFIGPKGDKGDKGTPGKDAEVKISTNPNNRTTLDTDGGIFTPDIVVDPLAYYILAKA